MAKELGRVDVDAMLQEISYLKFREWRAFDELEPFGEDRADVRSAHIVQTLANIARGRVPVGSALGDFVLPFGDAQYVVRPEPQSIETQTLHIETWIAASNAVFSKGS